MLRKFFAVLLVISALFTFSGCAVLLGGAAIGAGASGTYLYIDGEMKTDYYAPFDKVWVAVEKTVADMQGLDVMRSREIAQGSVNAVINQDKVFFTLKYKEKNVTTVSVRVGMLGNKLGSQLLHDKIAENLAKGK
jgi:hypothetical protein